MKSKKIKSIKRISLDSPTPVYDLEIKEGNNFCLANGVVVHNSKDIADALCGSLWSCLQFQRQGKAMVSTGDINKLLDAAIQGSRSLKDILEGKGR